MTAGKYLQHTKEQVITRLIKEGMYLDAKRIAACSFNGRRCGLSAICPVCRWSKGQALFQNVLPQVRASLERGERIIPATLLVPDVSLTSLRQTFQSLRQSVRRFTTQIAGLRGIVWGFESVPSPRRDGYEHPHGHLLLSVDRRNAGRDYTSALRLHQLWTDQQPGGIADVVNLSRVCPTCPNLGERGSNIPGIAARHAAYLGYALKASPAQVVQQVEAELEYDFVPRIFQLRGLHRTSITGSLQPSTPHGVRHNPVAEAA